jgi:Pyridoxamine 5'-phosphate oxidase
MRLTGPWSTAEIDGFLAASIIPLRLAVVTGSGEPLVLSLWFIPLEGALWCATPRTALVAGALRANPRCAFEVAGDQPPYKGVRGQANVKLHDDRGADILRRMLYRYAIAPDGKLGRMLIARAGNETALRIEPHRMTSWDFTGRMTG